MKAQLANILQERVGLSEEIALQAASVALAFVKEKLPDSISSHFDSLMAGESVTDAVTGALGDKVGGALGGLGGMFGGDK